MKTLLKRKRNLLNGLSILALTAANLYAASSQICTSNPDGCSGGAEYNPGPSDSCQKADSFPAGLKFCLSVPDPNQSCTPTSNTYDISLHTGACSGPGPSCVYSDQAQI